MKTVDYADLKTLIEMADVKGVKKFIRKGGDVNRMKGTQCPPLMYAVMCSFKGYEEMVSKESDGKDYTSADKIILLLLNAGADVNPDYLYGGCTPLLLAMEYGVHQNVIYKLVDAGSDLNAHTGYIQFQCNRNALLWSIIRAYDKLLVKYLIEKGVDLSYKDGLDNSPLFYSLYRYDNYEVASILINAGAVVSPIYDGNRRCLFDDLRCTRCEKDYCERNKEVIDLLLSKGIDLKLTDEHGRSVVHYTSCNYLINLCVKSGVSVNAKDNLGWTPLMYAVSKGNPYKVKSLLSVFGADINCTNSELDIALHLPSSRFSDVIRELLLYFGSNLYAKNVCNESPLDEEVTYFERIVNYSYYYENSNDDSLSSKFHKSVLMKYYLFFIDGNDLNDYFGNYEDCVQSAFSGFVSDCKYELTKLKTTFIKDGLSFYNFCRLKQFHKSDFINISVDEFKYNTKQIKEMFPLYYNSIVIRMEDNQLSKYKRDLLNSLEKIIIQPLGFNRSETQQVELIYDCRTLVARYIHEKDIYNLFLAAVDY